MFFFINNIDTEKKIYQPRFINTIKSYNIKIKNLNNLTKKIMNLIIRI